MNDAPPKHRHAPLRARLRRLMLSLHWVLGMVALLAMLFFAATGFLLNHAEDWELGSPTTSTREFDLDPHLAEKWTNPDAAIVALIRSGQGLGGLPEKPEFKDDKLTVVFKSPGVRHDITVEPATGKVRVETESHGLTGRLLELHRGKNAGAAWRLAIDGAALLLILLTLSGFWLWAATPAWRVRGLVGLAASALLLGVAVSLSL